MDTSKIVLPRSVVTELKNKVQDASTIAKLSPSVPQSFAENSTIVFTPSAEAEVVAEGAAKSAYAQEASVVTAQLSKIVTTTRVSDELKWADEDARLEIMQHIQADQQGAIARALDYIVYHAISPKTGTALTGYTALSAGANAVTTSDDASEDIDAMADALVNYAPNGIAMSRGFAGDLRKLRASGTGARLYPEIPLSLAVSGNVEGIPATVSGTVNGELAKTATKVKAFMGDFSMIKWGLARDVFAEIIEYGDPDNTGDDLKGHNQIAYRTEAVLATAVIDPKAFSVLKEKTTSSSSSSSQS